jgi:hypothetical protein
MKSSSRGFTNQQALLVLLICFPVGLIALGVFVILLQRPAPRTAQTQPPSAQEQPVDRSTTIQPLPSAKVPSDQAPSSAKVSADQESGLTEQQARGLVEEWLSVKSQIFAPPFNTDLADQVVAEGPLWIDLTKTNGSIEWLKNNNSYYTYSAIRVNDVIRFLPSPLMPSIVVSVSEDSVLHSPNGDKASSSTSNWLYTLKEEGGRWKIWDYRKQ